jgi:tetratricopeptide (TPR) repeat protein
MVSLSYTALSTSAQSRARAFFDGELLMRAFLIALGLGLAAYSGMLFIFAERQKDRLSTAFFERGVTYDMKGDYQRAIADYDEALRIDPNRKDAAKNRAVALGRLAKTAQASSPAQPAHGTNP